MATGTGADRDRSGGPADRGDRDAGTEADPDHAPIIRRRRTIGGQAQYRIISELDTDRGDVRPDSDVDTPATDDSEAESDPEAVVLRTRDTNHRYELQPPIAYPGSSAYLHRDGTPIDLLYRDGGYRIEQLQQRAAELHMGR